MSKILIVDDEQELVLLLENRLTTEGFDVVGAYDGEEAINKTKEENPELILLDVNMPGLNGYQVCRQLKDDNEYKKIPIILLTAKTSDSDQFWGQEAGADAYICKPYNYEELLQKIKELLEQ